MNSIRLVDSHGTETVFHRDGQRIWLERLCGVPCVLAVADAAPLGTGLAELATSIGRFDPDEWKTIQATFQVGHDRADGLSATAGLSSSAEDTVGQANRGTRASTDGGSIVDGQAQFLFEAADGSLVWESTWSVCPDTGVVSRRDVLHNKSKSAITVFRCQARFVLPPAPWEVYAQQSRWCNENQGQWRPLSAGGFRFGCVGGRTTQDGTPYVCLREVGSDSGLAMHVLPRGNWAIDVRTRSVVNSPAFAVVRLGMAEDDMHFELPADGSFAMPEILIQPLPQGQPHLAAPALHRYVQKRLFASARPELPVVYNTWFEQFEVLELPRLRDQLRAARRVGCEVFVVDAGWYGAAEGDWFSQAGDWRERQSAAFRGQMKAFADEVRAAGLGFGLWMEPERFGPGVPIRQEHPEWFLPRSAPFAHIDLTNPEAYAYLQGEIARLVETYGLAWMKVDFNFELGRDDSGAELAGYYDAWYRLLDEVRARYPKTIFEGCASGGMRLDLNTLRHFDGHFLSDTVHPIEVLRIWQGALLRLPPGGLIKWAVVRSVGRTIPTYTKSLADSPVTVVAPGCALWEPSETVDLDFAVIAALPGIFGLGGDLAGLPEESLERLAGHVAFFRKWRAAMRNSVAHLLTPPCAKEERRGWAAVQLEHAASGVSLMFVYRLDDGSSAKSIRLRGLNADATYEVVQHAADSPAQVYRGSQLLQDGLRVDLPARYRAAVFVVAPK
jgi:alpha-galactosidase